MEFRISPSAVLKGLSLVAIALTVANLVGVLAQQIPGHGTFGGLLNLFDFNSEQNIPTFYSSINLMLSALLLSFIALQRKSSGVTWLPWAGLSVILGFLSIDETASLHEQLAAPMQQMLNISGAFYYVWVIPYVALAGILFLLYFKFLMKLPARTRTLFILAGITFITGAVGFEVLGNLLVKATGSDKTLAYRLLFTCEELLEMLSVIAFIYTLLDYMVMQLGKVNICLENPLPKAKLSRLDRGIDSNLSDFTQI